MNDRVDPVAIGQVVDGRYRIEAPIGAGGLGAVYRATHLGLERPVALKVLHLAFGIEDDIKRRFAREARALSSLTHPRIVAATDFGDADGVSYLAMELLEGRTLRHVIDDGALEPDRAVAILDQILEGLAFAHSRGVIHRDLKPSNVLLAETRDGSLDVKILDFGLAKIGDPDADGPPSPTLTQLGTVLGTPAYMSPEQAATRAADARADVYSAGIVLYEMLVGRPPFEGSNRMDIIRAHLVDDVPPLARFRPGLEPRPELMRLLLRSLAKEKEARPANAGEMLAELRQVPRPVATLSPDGDGATRSQAMSGEEATVLASDSSASRASGAGAVTSVQVPGATAERVAPPRPRRAIWIAAAAVTALVVGLGLVGWAILSSAEPEPAAAAGNGQPGPRGSAVAAGEGAATGPTPRERVAPRDPMEGDLPRALRRPARRVQRGHPLSRAQIRALRRYQQEHETDPRPSLILARDHARREWLTASIERYAIAHAMDPSSRGNPWMLEDLLAMAQSDSHAREAGDLIAEAYGPEALGAIEAAVDAAPDAARRRRLTRLAQRIESASE